MSLYKDHFLSEPAFLQHQQTAENNESNYNRPTRHSFSNTRSTKPPQSKTSLAKRQSLPSSIQERVAHGERYKTEMCKQYQLYKSCRYDNKCQYAHGEAELRSINRHPKYKTEECRTYHSTGFCPYGSRCHFVHDKTNKTSELSPVKPQESSHVYLLNNDFDINRYFQLQILCEQQKEKQRHLHMLQLLIQQQKIENIVCTPEIWPSTIPHLYAASCGSRSSLDSESERGSPFCSYYTFEDKTTTPFFNC